MPKPRREGGAPVHSGLPRKSVKPRIIDDIALWEVYVIGPLEGCYKIGYSHDATKRLKHLDFLPVKLRLHARIKTPSPLWLERYLHTAYRHCHVRGEWYRLTAEDITVLRVAKFVHRGFGDDIAVGLPEGVIAQFWSSLRAIAVERNEPIPQRMSERLALAPDEERDVADYLARRYIDRADWMAAALCRAFKEDGDDPDARARAMMVEEARTWPRLKMKPLIRR